MLSYIKHNVVDTLSGVVAHGCNCQGVMGSGVALAIRKKWPSAYAKYCEVVSAHRNSHHPDMSGLLGYVRMVDVGHNELLCEPDTLFVANMFTQEYYGGDGRVYASLTAIERALDVTMDFCKPANLSLFIPRIGCGLGGLDWDTQVGPVVEKLQQLNEVNVFVCDLP